MKKRKESTKWKLAMKDEIDFLSSNWMWESTKLPEGKRALCNKWIYWIEEEHDDSKRYNVRLTVKGFQQKEGIDYPEVFSPVVKLNTIKPIFGIVAKEDSHL